MARFRLAVCTDAGMADAETPPTLVGHSAGAPAAVRTAITHGEALLGVIAVDGLRYAELEKDSAILALRGPRPAPRPAGARPTRLGARSACTPPRGRGAASRWPRW